MAASPLSVVDSPTRSLEWLGGPGALLSSTALSTGQLGSLGPIMSLVEGTADPGSGDSGSSLLPDVITAPANQLILDTHAQLESTGDQVAPLIGPVHGLTNLGETVGLGHLGESGNLLTDLAGTAANPTDPGAAAGLLTDSGNIAGAAGTLVNSVVATPAAGNGITGSGSVLAPATGIVNQATLDTQTTLADAAHQIPVLDSPVQALTGLGDAIGLGHVGDAGNLLTDLTTAPGAILTGGGLASLNPALADLGNVLTSSDTLIGSLTGATNGGGLISSGGLLGPLTNLANTAAVSTDTTVQDLGHSVSPLNDTIHGLTNLGDMAGLGHIGEGGNLVTDAASLPGDLLAGQGASALSPVLSDAGSIATATGGLVGDVTGLAGNLSGAGSPLGGGGLASVVGGLVGDAGHAGDGAGGLVGTVTTVLGEAGSGASTNPVTTLLTGLTGGEAGASHPLVDVSAGPATSTPAADVAVLSPGTETTHTVEASAGSAPAGQPGLLQAGLLSGDSIALPQSGNGADALVGQLHEIVPAATAAVADLGTSHDASADLGLAAFDLGGHAHATATDQSQHGTLTGTHLLGL